LIWTIVWGILYAILIPGKGIFDNGAFVGVVYAVVVAAAACSSKPEYPRLGE